MRFISFLTLLTLAIYSNAQTWTLDQCIAHALEHNIGVQQSEIQLQMNSNDLQQSKFNRLPSVNASANHNYNIGRSIDPWTNTFSKETIQSNAVSINASWLLFSANRLNNTIKLNELGFQANQYGLELAQNQISLAVASSFLQLIMAQENLNNTKEQVVLTEAQLDRTTKLVEAGRDNKGSVLNLQAQLASDQIQAVNAQNQVELARVSIMNMLQLKSSEPFDISYPIIRLDTIEEKSDINYLMEIARSNLPEIKQAELLVQQSVVNQKIVSSALYPSLSAYGNLSTVYSESGFESVSDGFQLIPIGYLPSTDEQVFTSVPMTSIVEKPFRSQLKDNFGQSIGLSLSIPVFNNLRNWTAVQNAALNQQISELNLQERTNQLETDVVTAYTNLKSAQSSYIAALANETAQKTNYDYTTKRFEAGMLNPTDLLLAKNRWFQSQQQLTIAKYELVFRQLIIAFYKGNSLSLQ